MSGDCKMFSIGFACECELCKADKEFNTDARTVHLRSGIIRLQNASYNLIVFIIHSGRFDDYTVKQFRELLSSCGYVKGDVVFGKEQGE